MSTTTISLGTFLRGQRERLAPAEGASRRRTPGLRREEVATRAGVSVTWYACLEQGRGGPPSEDMLERLARALELDRAARELMFLLAQQRPPPLVPTETSRVPRTLQRVLDGIRLPTLVKTPTWDIVAWNDALSVLVDYASVPPRERNLIRQLFAMPAGKARFPEWEAHAREALAIFRIEVARIGGSPEATALEAELRATSPDFVRLWAEAGASHLGMGVKRIAHPEVGPLAIEYSAFPVAGAEGLSMIVHTPATDEDEAKLAKLLARIPRAPGAS